MKEQGLGRPGEPPDQRQEGALAEINLGNGAVLRNVWSGQRGALQPLRDMRLWERAVSGPTVTPWLGAAGGHAGLGAGMGAAVTSLQM